VDFGDFVVEVWSDREVGSLGNCFGDCEGQILSLGSSPDAEAGIWVRVQQGNQETGQTVDWVAVALPQAVMGGQENRQNLD